MVESVARSLETPSITTSGSFPPVSEVVPRTRTLVRLACRWSPPRDTFTPARRPLMASSGLTTSPLSPKPPVYCQTCISGWSPFRLSGIRREMYFGLSSPTCANKFSAQTNGNRHAMSRYAASRAHDAGLFLPCPKERRRCSEYEKVPAMFIRAIV